MQHLIANPADPATFQRCKLDLGERVQHAAAYALHRDLLRVRREDPVFRHGRPGGIDGAVLGPQALVLRFFGGEHGDRLLLLNLGCDLHFEPAPQPLLAPPEASRWSTLWSSEHPRYGGNGTPQLNTAENWKIPGEAAVVLTVAANA
jgi:maltooligosyltrehalose trehalohydrolase